MLPPALLDSLVCPRSLSALIDFSDDGFLFCPASLLRYRVVSGVPAMLAEEAETVSEEAAKALIADARARGLKVPT